MPASKTFTLAVVRRAAVSFCALGASLAAVGGTALAAPGTPDGGFGSGGVASASANTRFFATAVQGNGAVVAAGESGTGTAASLLVERFTPAGAPDASFGSGGSAHGASGSVARAVAIQPDGKIVVVGQATSNSISQLIVERFNPNGQLDHGFGGAGVVGLLGGAASGSGNAVALQPDGKILAAGSAEASGSNGTFPRVAVVRLNANGSLDTGFRGGGVDMIDLGSFSTASALALQPDGAIVLAGSQAPTLQVTNAVIARLTPGGALDPSFASGGVYSHQYASSAAFSTFNALAVAPGGAIVAAGAALSGSTMANAILARFTSHGSPDGSFGSGGVASTPAATLYNAAGNMATVGADGVTIAPNGEIVAAGTSVVGPFTNATLWAFHSNGSADTGIGSAGKVTLASPTGQISEGAAIAISPTTGDLIAVGDRQPFNGAFTGIAAAFGGFGAPAPPPTAVLKVTLTGVAKSYKSSAVAKHGIKLTAGCNQACTLRVALTFSAATAKRLHILTTFRRCTKSHGHKRCRKVKGYRALTVSLHIATLGTAGTKTFVLRLSRSLAKAIERQKSVSVTVRVSATAKATHKSKVINKRTTLKR